MVNSLGLTTPELLGVTKLKLQKSGQRSVVQLFKEATVTLNRANTI